MHMCPSHELRGHHFCRPHTPSPPLPFTARRSELSSPADALEPHPDGYSLTVFPIGHAVAVSRTVMPMTSSDPSEMAPDSTKTSPPAVTAATVPACPPEEAEPVLF